MTDQEQLLQKLQGSNEGPQSDEEWHDYLKERERIYNSGGAVWILANNDPDSDGRVWDFFDSHRQHEVMQVRTTESPHLYEASAGHGGVQGSGLVSLEVAIRFVESGTEKAKLALTIDEC